MTDVYIAAPKGGQKPLSRSGRQRGSRYCAERIACRQVSPVITGGWCGRGARTRAERQGPGRDAAAAAVGAWLATAVDSDLLRRPFGAFLLVTGVMMLARKED